MVDRRVIEKIRKTNEKVASLLEKLGDISEKQLAEILKEIDAVKENKLKQAAQHQKELSDLKKTKEEIKKSNKKEIKRKDEITKNIDVYSDSVGEGFKKIKSISDATDKLIEKTAQVKKDALSVMSVFNKKEIVNNYSFTFTKSSLINSKSVVFQNTIIKNINIGQQIQKTSQSNENFDAETNNIEVEKLKILKTISEKLNNVKIGVETTTTKKEEPKESKLNWKNLLLGGTTGISMYAGAKKYGSSILGASKGLLGKILPTMESGSGIASKASKALEMGKGAGNLLGKVFGPLNALLELNNMKNRSNTKDSLLEKYKGNKDASDAASVGNLLGSFGSAVQGIAGMIPGAGLPFQALGFGISNLGDEMMDSSKEIEKKKQAEQKTFYDDKNASLKMKTSNSDITISNNYNSYNGTSLNNVPGIKGKKENSDYEAINDLIKNNENSTLAALMSKRKGLNLPKLDKNEKIDLTTLKSGKILKTLPERMPANMTRESEGKKGTFTTLAGSLSLATPGRISSLFGAIRILDGKASKPHKGMDIAAPIGTPIYAITDGTILNKNQDTPGGFGKYIEVTTNDGYKVLYGHLSNYGTKNGKISVGDLIGYVGNEGHSTGAHIHLQVGKGDSVYSTPIDPMIWLNEVQAKKNTDDQSTTIATIDKTEKVKEYNDFDDTKMYSWMGAKAAEHTNKEHQKMTNK